MRTFVAILLEVKEPRHRDCVAGCLSVECGSERLVLFLNTQLIFFLSLGQLEKKEEVGKKKKLAAVQTNNPSEKKV